MVQRAQRIRASKKLAVLSNAGRVGDYHHLEHARRNSQVIAEAQEKLRAWECKKLAIKKDMDILRFQDVDEAQQTASAVSSFTVMKTELDGINSHLLAGESNVFLVGKYRDQFRIESGTPLFSERIVQLDTRRLDKGSHWPI